MGDNNLPLIFMSTNTNSQSTAQQATAGNSNVISVGSAAAAGIQALGIADTADDGCYTVKATLDSCLKSDMFTNCRLEGNDIIMTMENGEEVRVSSRLTACVPVDVCVAMDILKYDIRHFTVTVETPCTLNHDTVHDAVLKYFHEMNIEFDPFRFRILSWSAIQDYG